MMVVSKISSRVSAFFGRFWAPAASAPKLRNEDGQFLRTVSWQECSCALLKVPSTIGFDGASALSKVGRG